MSPSLLEMVLGTGKSRWKSRKRKLLENDMEKSNFIQQFRPSHDIYGNASRIGALLRVWCVINLIPRKTRGLWCSVASLPNRVNANVIPELKDWSRIIPPFFDSLFFLPTT